MGLDQQESFDKIAKKLWLAAFLITVFEMVVVGSICYFVLDHFKLL